MDTTNRHLILVILGLLLGHIIFGQETPPRELYNGYCGWAIYKGYRYPAKKHIYVISYGDTIRFANVETKDKWLDVQFNNVHHPRVVADKKWEKIKAKRKKERLREEERYPKHF